VRPPLAAGASLVATAIGDRVPVFETVAAASPLTEFTSPNDLGATRAFLVVEDEGDWLKVYLPARPNGSTGWVRESDVTLSAVPYKVVVTLADHRLEVLDGDRVVVESQVAIGTSRTPTPPGTFFVTEIVETGKPNGPYGPYALGLSGYSEVLKEFNGGPGQLALHGTHAQWSIGKNASNGCIRLPNDVVTQLASLLDVGTPVVIQG
jgi:lipoprotein-anchoring transpeptidase ErfK/SrfK